MQGAAVEALPGKAADIAVRLVTVGLAGVLLYAVVQVAYALVGWLREAV
ncbi:MAG TPA: hypothetical protein VGE99_07305 [Candidatus Dormibacteraeota bacterium]